MTKFHAVIKELLNEDYDLEDYAVAKRGDHILMPDGTVQKAKITRTETMSIIVRPRFTPVEGQLVRATLKGVQQVCYFGGMNEGMYLVTPCNHTQPFPVAEVYPLSSTQLGLGDKE